MEKKCYVQYLGVYLGKAFNQELKDNEIMVECQVMEGGEKW